jgi:hypothetical protein
MFPAILFGGVLLALYLIIRYVKKRDKIRFETVYLVYVPCGDLPSQEVLMDRMVAKNPYNPGGRTIIGSREGLLFTDIRLYISTAEREKSSLLFRPDLTEDNFSFSAEALSALSDSHKVAIVRYVLDGPAEDYRHLTFLPHMAAALSDLCGGIAIADVTQRKLYSKSEFESYLRQHVALEKREAHVRLEVLPASGDHRIASFGLRKIGLPDFTTSHLSSDSLTMCQAVCEQFLDACWESRMILSDFEMDFFGTTMMVIPGDQASGFLHVRIGKKTPIPA